MATLEKKTRNSNFKQVIQQSQSATNSPKQPLVHQKKFNVLDSQNDNPQIQMQISTDLQSDHSSLDSVELDIMGEFLLRLKITLN